MFLFRRFAAVVVSLWLIGIPVTGIAFWSVVFKAPGGRFDHHLIFYWTIWGPGLALCVVIGGGGCGFILFEFYKWALTDPGRESRQERIERLERELNIRG